MTPKQKRRGNPGLAYPTKVYTLCLQPKHSRWLDAETKRRGNGKNRSLTLRQIFDELMERT